MPRIAILLALCAVAPSCTEPNAAAKCGAGSCSDPAYPYCDVEGTVSGEPGSCIAVTCEPGSILTCLGDDAFTCTSDGASYERVPCELGCRDTPEPHCAYVQSRYLPDICDSAASADSLTISSTGSFDPNLDSNCNGGVVEQPGAPSLCVVRYRTISIASGHTLTVVSPELGYGGRAIAFVADDDLIIDGTLDISANATVNGPGGGAVQLGGPVIGGATQATGGGGAGGKTEGGDGGTISSTGGGNNGGLPAADPAVLAALIGGAAAAQDRDPQLDAPLGGGGGGGGALLLSCRGTIRVGGLIDAGGGGGMGGAFVTLGGGGGGAGGYVALEAKDIVVTGELYANGGGGACGTRADGGLGDYGEDGKRSATDAAAGGAPVSGEGRGGKGGVGTTLPTDGEMRTAASTGPGGGGGSVGFFQTYTPTAREPTLTPTAISPAFQPNGLLMTR